MALTVIKGKFPEIGCEKQQGHKREIIFVNQVNDTGSCEPLVIVIFRNALCALTWIYTSLLLFICHFCFCWFGPDCDSLDMAYFIVSGVSIIHWYFNVTWNIWVIRNSSPSCLKVANSCDENDQSHSEFLTC